MVHAGAGDTVKKLIAQSYKLKGLRQDLNKYK